MNRDQLADYASNGMTIQAIADQTGKGATTVRYWLKKYGIKTIGSRVEPWIDEPTLRAFVGKSKCRSDVLRLIGRKTTSAGNFETLDKYIALYGIDTAHFRKNTKAHGKGGYKPVALSDVMTRNSQYARSALRRRLIKDQMLEYKCQICGISEWRGAKLNLRLDHINGVNNDHRMCNLRFVCPNCDSQLPTFCRGKSR